MKPWKGLNPRVRQTLTLEPAPWKGRINHREMAPSLELACELKVMEDTKDSLDNSHEGPEREDPASIVTNGQIRAGRLRGELLDLNCTYSSRQATGRASGSQLYIICVIGHFIRMRRRLGLVALPSSGRICRRRDGLTNILPDRLTPARSCTCRKFGCRPGIPDISIPCCSLWWR